MPQDCDIFFIDIGVDFSRTPGWRYVADGEFSGEAFRIHHLSPALRQHKHVIVDLDSAEGFSSSFLEEVFGGVVREFNDRDIGQRITLRAVAHPRRAERAEYYMSRAISRL